MSLQDKKSLFEFMRCCSLVLSNLGEDQVLLSVRVDQDLDREDHPIDLSVAA